MCVSRRPLAKEAFRFSRRASSPRITIAKVLSKPSEGITSRLNFCLYSLCTRPKTPTGLFPWSVGLRSAPSQYIRHMCQFGPRATPAGKCKCRRDKSGERHADAFELPDAAREFRRATPARRNFPSPTTIVSARRSLHPASSAQEKAKRKKAAKARRFHLRRQRAGRSRRSTTLSRKSAERASSAAGIAPARISWSFTIARPRINSP